MSAPATSYHHVPVKQRDSLREDQLVPSGNADVSDRTTRVRATTHERETSVPKCETPIVAFPRRPQRQGAMVTD